MAENILAHQFAVYSEWRAAIIDTIVDYQNWINEQALNDAQFDQRLQLLLERLQEDKLNVAFVAEFSRGKSELINAIFFAGYGKRLLPSSAGRTTMCPTELLYDKSKPSSIMLLPIETRLSAISTFDYKRQPEAWKLVEFDVDSNENMISAFKEVSRTKTVSLHEAEQYGLFDPKHADDALGVNRDGSIDVPCWRHAIINFPHPLLEQGLVILDTPGLNAMGTEPELTLNMLPNAQAIIFILGADTGVTKTEIEVWQKYLSGARWQQKGRLAVLNKIDGLWDELKTQAEIERELVKQIKSSAELLGLQASQIFPISAQKGLLAKVSADQKLLAKSRILELENALSNELIPSKKEIVRDNTAHEIDDLVAYAQQILDARFCGAHEQLVELQNLRGKNEDVVANMMTKIKADKDSFDKGLQQFQALRSILAQQSHRLFTLLGMDALKSHVHTTREVMIAASFTKTMRQAMDDFFSELSARLIASEAQIDEIKTMMDVMYERFSAEHGLRKYSPSVFSTKRYQKELAKLGNAYEQQFKTAFNMIVHEKVTLTSRFFETLASRVINMFEVANRDIEHWLKMVMSPMEAQVHEHQQQLRRRLESIKRIYKATDTLEERISELELTERSIEAQLDDLNVLRMHMNNALYFEVKLDEIKLDEFNIAARAA